MFDLSFFLDGEEDNIKQAQEVLKDVAHKYTEEQKATKNSDSELPELYFLYEGEEVSIQMGQFHK